MDAIHKNVSKTASNCTSSFLAQEEEFLEVFRGWIRKARTKLNVYLSYCQINSFLAAKVGIVENNLRADNPGEYWVIWYVEVNSTKKQFPQRKFYNNFLLRTPKEI